MNKENINKDGLSVANSVFGSSLSQPDVEVHIRCSGKPWHMVEIIIVLIKQLDGHLCCVTMLPPEQK